MTPSFVWGVDVALSRLVFACAESGRERVDVEPLITRTDATQGERMGLLDRQLRIFAGRSMLATGKWAA
jgi:hypothetical protein